MDKQQKRPIYLNIPKLGSKMSITAKVSILHRASGVLMFVALPFILSLFHKSLTNAEFYSSCYAIASLPIMKVIYTILIWAIMHHMCAGIRFVLLDMHKGIDRIPAQRSARWVMVVSLLLTIALGALIW
jgi:succinate dehydrogenase / fumarate reductase cytochrome b subunit